MEKNCENVAVVLQKRCIWIVAILYLANLVSDVKSVTYSMTKSSNKKRFENDILILKIQGNSKTVNNKET